MKLVKFLMFAVVAVALASCSSSRDTGKIADFSKIKAQTDVVRGDLDLNVANKVEGVATCWYVGPIRVSGDNKTYEDLSNSQSDALFGFFGGKKASIVERTALCNAMQGTDYDVVVNPTYQSEKHSWFFGLVRKQKCKAKGFGAKFKNLYQVETINTLKK